MKWQEINKTIKVLITSGSLVGAFGVIWMITFLTGSEVSYTNWENCTNGTACYARFEVEESYYRICFNIDETVTEPHYFKKVARSRTIWINTSLYGFVSTDPNIPTKLMVGTYKSKGIEQAPDGKWLRDIKTGDCIERTKTNYLYVKGEKQANQEVEWKADVFGIDPTWKGEKKKLKPKQILKTVYTSVTKTTKYDDNTVNIVIHSGLKYTDSKGTKIEDTKSLRDCEFCDEIKLEVDLDTKYPIEVLDYNLTHITVNLMTGTLGVGKDILLKVYSKSNESKVNHSSHVNLKLVTDKQKIVLPFGLDKVVKWGENSTTVRYNISGQGYVHARGFAGTGWNTIHDSTDKYSFLGIISSNLRASSEDFGSDTAAITRSFLPFNTSLLPDDCNLVSAYYRTNTTGQVDDDDNDGEDFIVVIGNTSQASTSAIVSGDFDQCGAIDNPTEFSNRIDISTISSGNTLTFNMNADGLNAISKTGFTLFGIREGHDVLDSPIAAQTGNAVKLNPDWSYLNITYTEAGAGDSCSNCDGTKDCYWDCSDECNITSNINMGGYNIEINQSTTGNHTITISANVTNWGNLTTSGYDSSNICTIKCKGQGGFK